MTAEEVVSITEFTLPQHTTKASELNHFCTMPQTRKCQATVKVAQKRNKKYNECIIVFSIIFRQDLIFFKMTNVFH